MNKPYINKAYMKWWIAMLVFTIVLVVPCALMPQILDYYDRPGSWVYNSPFHKDDLLNFYAAFFTFLGTVLLGVGAVFLSQQANDMNKRLIKIEENNYIPTIDINGMAPEELKEFLPKDVFAINLDDSFTDITDSMELSPETDGDVLVLTMTNVSRTDIINIELFKLGLKLKYDDGRSQPITYETLTISLNNKVPYQSTIPFLIGGIRLTDEMLQGNPMLSLTVEFHSTNFLGEVYVQKIKFDLISLWDRQINFPAVENKRNIMVYSY